MTALCIIPFMILLISKFCSRTLILYFIEATTGKWISMPKMLHSYSLTQMPKGRQKLYPWKHNLVTRGILHISRSHLSSDLRWHEHVAAVSAKATRVLNHLHKNINFCTHNADNIVLKSWTPWSDHIWNMPQLLGIHTPPEITSS